MVQFGIFCLLICSLSICGVRSDIEDHLKEDFFSIYTHGVLKARNITEEPVTPDQIKYFLFTKNNPGNYTEIDPENPFPLVNTNVKIVFIIHGWIEKREVQWYEDLKNAFLNKQEEHYVVQVDWSHPAHQTYAVSSYNTKDVGNFIGEFISKLHKNLSIPLENFLVVGHSLGGQVSGFIGKKVKELTGKKLPRIIALDAAGPLFISRPDEERLNKNDAEVVQCIHTDGGTFGFKPSCGTIDFFPNGGNGQPGCTKIEILNIKSIADPVICDHQRSWGYFIEAVLNPEDFVGTKCSSWIKYKTKLCDGEQVAMGDLKTKATGEFYLETNKDKPFAKKRSGSVISNLVKH